MTKSKLMLSTLIAGGMMMIAGQALAFGNSNNQQTNIDVDVDAQIDQSIDNSITNNYFNWGGGNSSSSSENNYEWNWDADVYSDVSIDLNIDQAEDYALAEIEQIQLGDVTATSEVVGVIGDKLKIDSAATAVANNISIEGEEIANVHTTQFVMESNGYGDAHDLSDALDMTDEALGGDLQQADVSAYTNVSWAGAAEKIDATSTALANNLSLTVNPGDTESIAIADASQFSFADVTATTHVGGIAGVATNAGAKVNAAASAIGNNISIKVGLDD